MTTKVVEKGNGVVELSTSLKGDSWKAANEKAIKKLADTPPAIMRPIFLKKVINIIILGIQ